MLLRFAAVDDVGRCWVYCLGSHLVLLVDNVLLLGDLFRYLLVVGY